MITEDYVSFEIAKLLKEKEFDEYCPLWYNLDKPLEGPFFYKEIGWYGHNSYDYNGKRIVSALTHQMACKWLREVHKIDIEIFVTYKNKIPHYQWRIERLNNQDTIVETPCCNTYEEAVEAALKYTLENLI